MGESLKHPTRGLPFHQAGAGRPERLGRVGKLALMAATRPYICLREEGYVVTVP